MTTGKAAYRTWLWRLVIYGSVLLTGVLALLFMTSMPGRSYQGPLDPLSEEETAIRGLLKTHVEMLAETIGERNVFSYSALMKSADYISETFTAMGYSVNEQTYEADGKTVKNLWIELPGATLPEEIILLGAHYDSTLGTPGANDNASGVAALLELARLVKEQQFARTVRFVAFTNEEPPHFQTPDMGSWVYAKEAAQRGDQIVAMLSLETMGYYSDEEGSQTYPPPFNLVYPSKGNFLAFVGNLASRNLVRRTVAIYRENSRFPSEGVAAPNFFAGLGWSDHWSFWQEGYPGIMVSDTATFRYKFYHTPQDTPDKLDYDRMARIVTDLVIVVEKLAEQD